MSVKTYKTIKATAQLAAILAVTYAMTIGLDPETGGIIIGAIVLGPEYVEKKLLDEVEGGN